MSLSTGLRRQQSRSLRIAVVLRDEDQAIKLANHTHYRRDPGSSLSNAGNGPESDMGS